MSAIPQSVEPDQREIANWFRLFSDERFHKLSSQSYSDHDFIREHCRLGFQKFVNNSADQALLQLFSKAADRDVPAIIGTPFTPCHWGTLAALFHIFRNGNHDLRSKRTVYWLTTEPRERTLFTRLRMHARFRRVCEAINFASSPEEYEPSWSGTSLVLLHGLHELGAVRHPGSLIVSDGRGELVFRKGETQALLGKLAATQCLVTLIVPSRCLTYGLAPDWVCWPWSESAFANARVTLPPEGDAIPWKWAAGAHLAGNTARRVMAIAGLQTVEELLVELKGQAYRLFTKPKSFYDLRCRIEFQRIVGIFRQLAIPFSDFDGGSDPRRLTARLSRLDADVEGTTKDVGDEIKIGLLYVRDLIKKLQFSEGKWDLLKSCVDECIAEGRELGLAFPQADPHSAEQTIRFVQSYAERNGASINVQHIEGPDDLPSFRGEVVLLGVPKLSQASRWRIPFRGRLTVLAWQFDRIFASMALRESNESAETVRRRTWTRFFQTPLGTHLAHKSEVSTLDEESHSGEVAEVDGEIEAFDLSYRGVSTDSESIVSTAVRAKAGYVLTLDDRSTMLSMAAEEQHILIDSYGSKTVKTKMTSHLQLGDKMILINGESYSQLTKRLQRDADRAASRLSFSELMERWQMLCLEQDDDQTAREGFIKKIADMGCDRGRGTIVSWLKLKRMGPERYEDIQAAALAVGDFDFALNAKHFWDGLEEQRSRHRRLGAWLKKALTRSASIDRTGADTIVDPNLGLTFADLQRGISVKSITEISRPAAVANDE